MMQKAYRYLLFISVAIAAVLFIHDYIYDKPAVPYTLFQVITEILFAGAMCVGLIWGLLSGLYFVVVKLTALRGKTIK